MTDTTQRLKSALKAVAESNKKTAAADAAVAKLTAAIDAVPSHQADVNALANLDANAFETWARADDGSEPPTIDAAAHHAASLALIEAQKKAQAAASALTRIEQERTKARTYGEAAQAAITPIAAQIVLAKRIPEIIAEATDLQTKLWHASAQLDEAYALAIIFAESLPKGSEEAREIYTMAEKLGGEIRQRRQGYPADVNAIRQGWVQEINETIQAISTAANEEIAA